MAEQLYFIKTGFGHQHKNNLEKSIANALRRYDMVLTNSPATIRDQIAEIVSRYNRSSPRCKPTNFTFERCYSNSQDFSAKVIGLGGMTVWTATLYAVRDKILKEPGRVIETPNRADVSSEVGTQLSLL